MKKITIGVGAIVVLVLGYYLFQGSAVSYVATVTDDVTQLEAELAEIDAAVQAGAMTPEAAAKVQAKIYARLDSINKAIEGSQKLNLTPEQQAELVVGLNRMKDVLGRYRATLTAIDEAVLALPESKRPKSKGDNSRKGAITTITEAIDMVEEHVEDVVGDYVPEEEEVTSDDPADTVDDVDNNTDSTDDNGVEDESVEDAAKDDQTDSDSDVEAPLEATTSVEMTEEENTLN